MIKYVTGDATNPQGEGNKIICHVSNNKLRWGRGFVLALSKRWKAPEQVYRSVPIENLILGDIQTVEVENDIKVINMIAQHDTISNKDDIPPIRYDALLACLIKVNEEAIKFNATIHAPKFGAGLSGGDWNKIEEIIKKVITVDIIIYNLK